MIVSEQMINLDGVDIQQTQNNNMESQVFNTLSNFQSENNIDKNFKNNF